MWKLKQFFRKILPFLVIGGVAFGGWNLYKSSIRHGRPSFVRLLQKIPYFGSRFRHYSGDTRQAYRSGSKSYSRARHRGTHRRHHTRRQRRHRR